MRTVAYCLFKLKLNFTFFSFSLNDIAYHPCITSSSPPLLPNKDKEKNLNESHFERYSCKRHLEIVTPVRDALRVTHFTFLGASS